MNCLLLALVLSILLGGCFSYAAYKDYHKKGTYKGDLLGLLIDSVELLALVGAIILVGVIFLTER